MGLKGKGRKLNVSVRLGYPINNMASQRIAHLEIRDQDASIVVIELELDPEQLMALMANTTAYAEAWTPQDLSRLGKRMENGSTVIGGYELTSEQAWALAKEWAATHGWEQVDMSKNNVGKWIAHGRRWVEP